MNLNCCLKRMTMMRMRIGFSCNLAICYKATTTVLSDTINLFLEAILGTYRLKIASSRDFPSDFNFVSNFTRNSAFLRKWSKSPFVSQPSLKQFWLALVFVRVAILLSSSTWINKRRHIVKPFNFSQKLLTGRVWRWNL